MEKMNTPCMKYADTIRQDLRQKARQRVGEGLLEYAEYLKTRPEKITPNDITIHLSELFDDLLAYLLEVQATIECLQDDDDENNANEGK